MLALKKVWGSTLRQMTLKKGSGNILFFFSVIVTNIAAALLEGISFSLILLAFKALSGNVAITSSPIISLFPNLSSWVNSLSSDSSFVFFIVLAILAQSFRSGLGYLGQVLSLFLAIRIQVTTQEAVYKQIFRFSFPFVHRYKTGDLLEYAKMPATLITVLLEYSNKALVSGFTILASGMVMLLISPPLTLLSVFTFGLLILFQKIIIKKVSKTSKSFCDFMVEFSKHAVQSLHMMRLVHTFSRQSHVLHLVRTSLDKIADKSKKMNLLQHLLTPISEIGGVLLVGIFLVLGHFWFSNDTHETLPMLLTFIIIVYRVNTRSQLLIASVGVIASHWGELERFEEIISDQGKEYEADVGQTFHSFLHKIEFQDVCLTYPNTDEPALQALNLQIFKGSVVAFVGSTGAGKSSIIDLLLRLYHPTQGSIQVDGIDLKDYEISSWRDKLGVVSQDLFILNDTIEENIRFGNLTASLDQIVKVAKLTGAHDFISQLSHTYQTVLGERGYRLSGGEKQKIVLCRALIRDPDILILDEATSNLDSQSEQSILQAVAPLYGKKTIAIVAHRLSTIMNADRIFVLDRGTVVETGTHKELLASKGKYAMFWNIQANEEVAHLS